MSLKERIYSVLLVSSNDSFTSAFTGFLPPSRDINWFTKFPVSVLQKES